MRKIKRPSFHSGVKALASYSSKEENEYVSRVERHVGLLFVIQLKSIFNATAISLKVNKRKR